MTGQQLVFDWPQVGSDAAGDFFVSDSNRLAYDTVMGGNWPDGKLCLIGPPGSGKSHIARIWARAAGATVLTQLDAPLILPTVVEDADRLCGPNEEALFHLHNALRLNAPLLLTASAPPARWDTRLPDLASRMQATMVAQIAPPDDDLMQALIIKLFADRQLVPGPDVARYLATRLTRTHAQAARAVKELDAAALALGREINRALASDWMAGKLGAVTSASNSGDT